MFEILEHLPYSMIVNASVTFALRRVYDARTMSKSLSVLPPQGDLAIIIRIYGHRGLYDFV